ncbi:MAG: hypothetical protein J7L31_00450 [Thermoplasmata archaeon]|nr:hypothetical protein [Thermoplasmata archaeon]
MEDIMEVLGLHVGIGDVIEDNKRIGECIFDLEIVMMPTGKIEAQGVIDEFTEGKMELGDGEKNFIISGVISRGEKAYATTFRCTTYPYMYPKFTVVDAQEIINNLSPVEEEEEKN